jgi:hypothetical protein
MVIDDLPTGSLWVFTANCIISFFFQFIGFLLTYLLHTSHAGKYGSRAGLGITLIQFGFYSRTAFSSESGDQAEVEKPKDVTTPPSADELLPAVSSKDWLAFLFMTLGMFKFFLFSTLLSSSCSSFQDGSSSFHQSLGIGESNDGKGPFVRLQHPPQHKIWSGKSQFVAGLKVYLASLLQRRNIERAGRPLKHARRAWLGDLELRDFDHQYTDMRIVRFVFRHCVYASLMDTVHRFG